MLLPVQALSRQAGVESHVLIQAKMPTAVATMREATYAMNQFPSFATRWPVLNVQLLDSIEARLGVKFS